MESLIVDVKWYHDSNDHGAVVGKRSALQAAANVHDSTVRMRLANTIDLGEVAEENATTNAIGIDAL
jgi:hypothetical protein